MKKFEAQAKEMLVQSDLGSWYRQSFWENENHLAISSSRQKIVLQEEDIEVSNSGNTSKDEEDFPEIPESFIIIDMRESQSNIDKYSFRCWNEIDCHNPRGQNKQIYLLVNQRKLKKKI